MANPAHAIPENAPGDFFVDSTCVNCGASRHFAPGIFGDTGDYAFVQKQPEGEEQLRAAVRALVACPTASIGMREKTARVRETLDADLFPFKLAENIFVNGYNDRKSYGAHSYFIQHPTGNWLIDSPRYVSRLVKKFEELGGIRTIFLSHRDDVADADKYARHFGAQRMIHRLERRTTTVRVVSRTMLVFLGSADRIRS